MRRFSILGLMGLVLAIAVAFAALRGANEFWAGGLLLAVLGLIGCSILGAILGRGAPRAASLGFLILGGGYFLALRILPVQDSVWLPTSQFLAYVEREVVVPGAVSVSFTPTGTLMTAPLSPFPAIQTPNAPANVATTLPNMVVYSYQGVAPANGGPGINRARIWSPIFPGAANGEAFRSVGHSLFTLVAGWLGVACSRRILARQDFSPDRPPEIENSRVAGVNSNVV